MARPVVVIDQIFSSISEPSAQSKLQDFVLSMVFANAAARAQSKDGTLFATDPYRNAWSNTLGSLGWLVTGAGTSVIKTDSYDATTTVADRIAANAPSDAIVSALSALNAYCKEDAEEPSKLTKLWWESGNQFDTFFASVGAVNLTDDVVVVELAQFSVDLKKLAVKGHGLLHPRPKSLDPTSACAIFDEVLERSIDMTTFHIQAEMHAEKFETRKSELEAKLGDKIFDHFLTQPAGLYGDAS